jgi:competence protein ComEC
VGQGDSAVIESPTGKVIVIDGGGIPGMDARMGEDPGNRVVVPYLRSRGISAVDLLVPTHPDDDHVQGLISVVEQMPVRSVLDGKLSAEGGAYARLSAAIAQRNIPVQTARRGQRVDIGGGAYLEVLHPTARRIGGEHPTNNDSIVLRLIYGKSRILFTGDAEEEAEANLIASGQNLAADVLKVGHHGSRWSTTALLLASVRPSVAVVSAGRDNFYNHPHPEVLSRLQRRNIRLFRTDTQGAIRLETDGVRIRLHATKPASRP